MARVQTALRTEMCTQESMLMENLKVRVNMSGPLVKSTLETFSEVKSMEKASGGVLEICRIAISTTVTIKMTESMAKAYSHGLAEISIKETILRMNGKVMVKCYGQMEACMRGSGSLVFSTESVV